MWSHTTKFAKKTFTGNYRFFASAEGEIGERERVFTLTNGKKVISFESWQAAKAAGWVKIG